LLQVRKNGVGEKAVAEIVQTSEDKGIAFADALAELAKEKKYLSKEYVFLSGLLASVKKAVSDADAQATVEQLQVALAAIRRAFVDAGIDGNADAFEYLNKTLLQSGPASVAELVSLIAMAGLTEEQEQGAGAVNILTMHKAKGLSARAAIVMACEDEYIPGRQQDPAGEADERRLLYVSLTRARERLFVTYALKRGGPQQHSGRNSGSQARSLTRYLRNAPVHVSDGDKFVESLGAK
jgi:DNA helicase-2/ATP-dependent DNA helicase PcrA